jgi:hypothetical protein
MGWFDGFDSYVVHSELDVAADCECPEGGEVCARGPGAAGGGDPEPHHRAAACSAAGGMTDLLMGGAASTVDLDAYGVALLEAGC